MKIKRTVFFSIFIAWASINLSAQKHLFDHYEVGLTGSVGLSALHFTIADGSKPSYGAGFAYGCDVAVILSDHWSLGTGLNMASYHASISSKIQETRNLIATPAGLPADTRFYMDTEYRGYEERHDALFIRFPLMAQYRIPAGAQRYFYVSAGVQTGIRVNATCRIRTNEIVTKGFSEFTKQYYEGLPVHGFDSFSEIKSKSRSDDFGIVLSGALETGVIWMLKNEMSLYTGLFLDYGLNDIRKSASEKAPIEYHETEMHTFNSILQSQNDGRPMTGKVLPLAVGLRLRWSIRF